MSDNNIEHQFLWQIENFSACTEDRSYCLRSPFIRARCLDDSQWKLLLDSSKDDDFISIAFFRHTRDNGPTALHLNVKVSLIDIYGKQPFQKGANCILERGRKRTFRDFVRLSDIFDHKDHFLPNDVLTLLVRARKSDCDTFRTRSVVCTKILVGRSTFLWKVRRLCRKASVYRRVIPFESSSVFPNYMELSCEYDNTIGGHKVPGDEYVLRLAIRPKDVPRVRIFMSAKIQILDSHQNPHATIEADHFFSANSEDEWHLPSVDMNDGMKVLLDGGRLHLDCDFSISDGSLKEGEVTSMPLAEFYSEENTLQQDIRAVYKSIIDVTPDIQLNICNSLNYVGAHKLILSARSVVFREVLNNFEIEKKRRFDLMGNDAKLSETHNEVCVRRETMAVFERSCKDYAQISNTSHDVLVQMLKCMYTDKLYILNENNAMALYLAGVRFDFRHLREKSEIYLMHKISLKSFHRMLQFAHSTVAVRLKSECLSFISKNWDFVLASHWWNKHRADYEGLEQEILNIINCEGIDF